MFKVEKRYGKQAGQWQLKRREPGKKNPVPVPRASWPPGLRPDMTVEDATAYIKTLNSSQRVVLEERSRIRAEEKLASKVRLTSAFLPAQVVVKYERHHIDPITHANTKQKKKNTWVAVQKLIAQLEAHPSEWMSDCRLIIFAYLKKEGWSWDYCKRVLAIMNTYGLMYCRALGGSFEPVELKHEERVQIQDSVPEGSESDPISLPMLASLYGEIPDENWNWLWIAFWFALRPHELPNEDWSVTKEGVQFYMAKLRLVRREWRYKQVPLTRTEQEEALRLLQTGKMQRPTTRQFWKWFGKGVGAYGCRHGFAVLMASQVDIRTLSLWLGHRSVTTTERYYIQLGLRKD